MIRHVVLFKFKPETDPATREHLIAQLRSLRTLDMVRDLSVGRNFTRSPRACDVALVVDVEDVEGLLAYGEDLRHIPIRQFAAQICEIMPLVDYELDGDLAV